MVLYSHWTDLTWRKRRRLMGEGKRVWPFLRVTMKRVEQMVSPTPLTFDPLPIPLITDSSYRDLSSVAVIASSVPLSVPLFRNQPQETVRHAHVHQCTTVEYFGRT